MKKKVFIFQCHPNVTHFKFSKRFKGGNKNISRVNNNPSLLALPPPINNYLTHKNCSNR